MHGFIVLLVEVERQPCKREILIILCGGVHVCAQTKDVILSYATAINDYELQATTIRSMRKEINCMKNSSPGWEESLTYRLILWDMEKEIGNQMTKWHKTLDTMEDPEVRELIEEKIKKLESSMQDCAEKARGAVSSRVPVPVPVPVPLCACVYGMMPCKTVVRSSPWHHNIP